MNATPLAAAILVALSLSCAPRALAQEPVPPPPPPPTTPEDTPETTLSEVSVQETHIQEGGQFDALQVRRESAQLLDVLSAEQMSRAGDSDAAAALRRSPG